MNTRTENREGAGTAAAPATAPTAAHTAATAATEGTLTKHQFQVLSALATAPTPDPRNRALAERTGLSTGTISATLQSLKAHTPPALDANNQLTPHAEELLAPYKVQNALIMAAGLSSRFAPISYEKPKGLLTVRGEVLIERQIKQLQEAGITDITVVLGYKKEEFFYLEDEFGVKIRINEEYLTRNNNSTIKRVEKMLGNTYICSSDDYFTINPFEQYVYESYYALEFAEGETEEYCCTLRGKDDRITQVTIGGADAWVMLGHAYWDRTFAAKFTEILNREYDHPGTADKLWEQIYLEHIKELHMVARKYAPGEIWEFDSLDEVRAFDPAFIANVNSTILDNICEVLKCDRAQIESIVPIKQGLTNLSFKFSVAGADYVYRHPGDGTDEIINRESELFSQKIAHDLGLDKTFIYGNGAHGWKLSHFIEGCHTLDYGNWDEVARALSMVRKLHDEGTPSTWDFDVYAETEKILALLDESAHVEFKDFAKLHDLAAQLKKLADAGGAKRCLCHNDFYDPNILVRDDEMFLIDWEYSGMSDYASDLGTFICCAEDYELDDAKRVFDLYFGRTPTPEELLHCVAYAALSSYYWFIWALYKEACGDPVGEWLYLWYKNAKNYGKAALEIAEGAEEGASI